MSLTITQKSRELNKIEQYLMTSAPGIKSLKDVPDGTSIPVDGWCIFEDDKDGKTVEICSIITPDRVVYAFQSMTARRSLLEIADIMGDSTFSVIKLGGTTKAGRPYINLTLDVDSIQ